MARVPIRFGTSGWRGIIADDFTFDGVRVAAAAIGRFLREQQPAPAVLVGYDRRFFSEEFARAAADALAAEGVRVVLGDGPVPTPAVAAGIVARRLSGGVNITASHNPAEYSGVKFSDATGAPCSVEQARRIEALAEELAARPRRRRRTSAAPAEMADCARDYFDRLATILRLDRIRAAGLHLFYDAMHGCGAGYLDRLLAEHGIAVTALRTERDVLFAGHPPDPAPEHLQELRHRVAGESGNGLPLGLATDGDADRFGIVDERGQFVSPNHVLALLYDYLLDSRAWRLGVARSVATTHLLDAIAQRHGLPVYETPVGFKFVGRYILEGSVALGGEESAGMSIFGHLPEKDGILACLLVAEMVAERGPLSKQLRTLFDRLGFELWSVRRDVPLNPLMQARLLTWMQSPPERLCGRRVQHLDRIDGVRLQLEDGAWLLVRPSGTEPRVRLYAEASSVEQARRLTEEIQQWLCA